MKSTFLKIYCRNITEKRLAEVKADLRSCGLYILRFENKITRSRADAKGRT